MNERRRRMRWPWIVLGTLAALVLLAAVAIPALLKPERFRGRIETALQSATGWEAELGELDVSLTRGLALTVSPGSLRAPGGDSSRFDIETLAIHAQLWPLLRGQLVIDSVALVAPEILLVQPDETAGWVLPIPGADSADSAPAGDGGGLDVSIDRIAVERGRLVLDDRIPPGQRLALDDVSLTLDVLALAIDGSAALGDGAGRMAFRGPLEGAITLDLTDLRTEFLHPWIGKDLLHAGGLLSGEVVVDWPESVRGELTGKNVTLLAGERPFEESTTSFEIGPREDGLELRRLEFSAGGARLTGSGPLSPDLALDLELPRTALETTLRAAESVLPLPLDLEPPGNVEARFDVDMPSGGALTYAARGELSAARFVTGEGLPAASDVRADFELDRKGVLKVRVLDGTVGGGKVQGTAWVEPVYPPGRLRFEGGLQDAILGQLLDGFIPKAGDEIRGPTAIRGKLGLNLAGALDAKALGGQVELDASKVSLPGWDLEGAILGKLQEKLGKLTEVAALFDRDLAARLDAQSKAKAEAPLATELFESVKARVDFDSWPWKLDNLSLGAGGVSAAGSGTFDPSAGAVKLSFTARLSPEMTAELVARHPQVKPLVGPAGGLALPLTIEGPMLKPAIGVNLEGLALEALGQETAKDALKDALRGLIDKQRDKK